MNSLCMPIVDEGRFPGEVRGVEGVLEGPRPGLRHEGAKRPCPCVYLVVNRRTRTFHTGATSDLSRRLEGDTLHSLVWFELHPTMKSAVSRERAMRKWKKDLKIRAVQGMNPAWQDLSHMLV
jgi:putative endonuclease